MTDDFWKYDPVSDSWTQMSNFPVETNAAVCFTIGDAAYAYTYSSFRRFDGAGWTPVNAPQYQMWEGVAFTMNGLGYFGLGHDHHSTLALYEYNPQAGTFQSYYMDFDDRRSGPSAFVIGDKAYIVGGFSWYDGPKALNDVWEFDPSKPEP